MPQESFLIEDVFDRSEIIDGVSVDISSKPQQPSDSQQGPGELSPEKLAALSSKNTKLAELFRQSSAPDDPDPDESGQDPAITKSFIPWKNAVLSEYPDITGQKPDKSGFLKKHFREWEHPRGDDGRFIDKAEIAEAASAPRKAVGLMRRTNDPKQRDLLMAALASAGMEQSDFEYAVNLHNWFGDSKVVDREGDPTENVEVDGTTGEPKPVYHGTPTGGWTVFDKSKLANAEELLYGPGFYFTEDITVADDYASNKSVEKFLPEKWREIEDTVASLLPEDYKLQVTPRVNEYLGSQIDLIYKDGKETAKNKVLGYESSDSPGYIILGDEGELINFAKKNGADELAEYIDSLSVDREIKKVFLKIGKPFDVDGTLTAEEMYQFGVNLRGVDWAQVPTSIGKTAAEVGDDVAKRANTVGVQIGQLTMNYHGSTQSLAASSLYDYLKANLGKSGANWALQQGGYDGITHIGGNIMGGGYNHRVWIALEPNQIKSVDNVGSFDSMDPDITKSIRKSFPDITDRDGDGMIYDGTEYERAAPSTSSGEQQRLPFDNSKESQRDQARKHQDWEQLRSLKEWVTEDDPPMSTVMEEIESNQFVNPSLVNGILDHYEAERIEFLGKDLDLYRANDGSVVGWDGKSNSFSAYDESDLEQLVYDYDLDDAAAELEQRFNDEFWEYPAPLWHATTEENIDSIKETGLKASSETRGISNRSVGSAVFTTLNPEYLASGSYGDQHIEIDMAAMKRDGLTPFVAQEPDIAMNEVRRAFADKLGIEDFHMDIEYGMDPDTVIVHASIPAKYLKFDYTKSLKSTTVGSINKRSMSCITKSHAWAPVVWDETKIVRDKQGRFSNKYGPTPTKQDLTGSTLYHASYGELKGAPRTTGNGFFLAFSPEAAQRGGEAGNTFPGMGISFGKPGTVSQFKINPDAKVFGLDVHLEGVDLPEQMTEQEFYEFRDRVSGMEWHSDERVNDKAKEIARQLINHGYADKQLDDGSYIAVKLPAPAKYYSSGEWEPIDVRSDRSYAPAWEGFEYDKVLPRAIRAIGFDASFVADEAGLSLSALTDNALLATEEAADQTDTPEFREWFGESKIVNEDGSPKIVYHGTSREFSEFSHDAEKNTVGSGFFGDGFYFTEQKKAASQYGPNLIAAYLRIENPYDFRGKSMVEFARDFPHLETYSHEKGDTATLGEILEAEDAVKSRISDIDVQPEKDGSREVVYKLDGRWVIAGSVTQAQLDRGVDPMEDLVLRNALAKAKVKNLRSLGHPGTEFSHLDEVLQSAGYDGAIGYGTNLWDAGASEYAVFSPTQIKSIDNTGTFNPTNPDITKSAAGAAVDIRDGDNDGLIYDNTPYERPAPLFTVTANPEDSAKAAKEEYLKLPDWVQPRARQMWDAGGSEWDKFMRSADQEGVDGKLVGEHFAIEDAIKRKLEEERAARIARARDWAKDVEGNYRNNPQVDTPEFKDWFGESKIVNQDGSPRVVFHGTRSEFSEFRTPSEGLVNEMLGIHLAKDPRLTDAFTIGTYARDTTSWGPSEDNFEKDDGRLIKLGGHTKPCYVRMENPYVIPRHSSTDQYGISTEVFGTVMEENPEAFIHFATTQRTATEGQARDAYELLKNNQPVSRDIHFALSVDQKSIDRLGSGLKAFAYDYGMEFSSDFQGQNWGEWNAREYRRIMQERGYDGIIYENTSTNEIGFGEPGSEDYIDPASYIVFEPTQIKSATGNDGSFDPNNPDITKEFRGEIRDHDGDGLIFDGTKWERPAGDFSEEHDRSRGQKFLPFDNPKSKFADTKEFKQWFGDSKIKNDDGSPRVVYHSTTSGDFSQFHPWSHFGTYRQAQDRFDQVTGATGSDSDDLDNKRTHGGRVYPVHLRIESPLRLPDMGQWENPYWVSRELLRMHGGSTSGGHSGQEYAEFYMDEDTASLYGTGGDPAEPESDFEFSRSATEDLKEVFMAYASSDGNDSGVNYDEFSSSDAMEATAEIMRILKDEGFDGIEYKNAAEGTGNDSYIVFDPPQVKSAIANSGEFDSSNPDIAKQYRGDIRDHDSDGLIYDGTKYERAAPKDLGWDDLLAIKDTAFRTAQEDGSDENWDRNVQLWEAMKQKLSEKMTASHSLEMIEAVDGHKADYYRQAVKSAIEKMAPGAIAQIGKNVASVSYYMNMDGLTRGKVRIISKDLGLTQEEIEERIEATLKTDMRSVGMWVFREGDSKGVLHLNGGGESIDNPNADHVLRTVEVYKHELAHALDGTSREHSFNPEWMQAWHEELRDGSLSRHAGLSAVEGFAEFGRSVFSGMGRVLRESYPKCFKYWNDREWV